jgi:replicative DNA helicase
MTDFYPPEESAAPASQMSTAVPHSREAEEAVVGAVLINPEAYYDIAQFLTADDFYIHRNKWIWESFGRLHEQRIPVDLLTLSEELERAGQLAEIGGSAYLTSMINQVPTSLNAEAYGKIVEENSIRRKMIQAANQIASLAYKGDKIDMNFDLFPLIKKVEQKTKGKLLLEPIESLPLKDKKKVVTVNNLAYYANS